MSQRLNALKAPVQRALCLLALVVATLTASAAPAYGLGLEGEVRGGGAAIAGAEVTLFASGPGKAVRLGAAETDAAGRFSFADVRPPAGAVLYLVASGGRPRGGAGAANPAIGLLAVLGSAPPRHVVVNELTTVASVWTAAQLFGSDGLSGNSTGLRIAAGNVPNLVDLSTGGFGGPVQDALNGAQTTTLVRFASLGNLLAGCVTQAAPDACPQLFSLATPPRGKTPADTLEAAVAIARHPWNNTAELFQLMENLYPVPEGGAVRPTPFLPYLFYPPTSWALALRYSGGGLDAPGGIAIDADGNAWSGNNFLPGSQSTLLQSALGGKVSKTAPDGKPLSPMTFGYAGGGVNGPGFGVAIRDDQLWVGNFIGRSVSVLRMSDGSPLSPSSGYTVGGRLGQMQGLIVDLQSNVWGLDNENSQVVLFPKGDPAKATLLCNQGKGCKVSKPFHLAVDGQNRIWITNGGSNNVTRFPADHPELAEQFPVGRSPKGMAIDSQGHAWITNFEDSSITHLLPSGKEAEGSPYRTPGIREPWGVAIDGNDNVWVAVFGGKTLVELCGNRPETCPPGVKTGEPISPGETGYVGGGMQHLTDAAIDSAGNVWVANNWDDADVCLAKGQIADAESTLCGGDGFVVFLGLAKPVATPLVGPPKAL